MHSTISNVNNALTSNIQTFLCKRKLDKFFTYTEKLGVFKILWPVNKLFLVSLFSNSYQCHLNAALSTGPSGLLGRSGSTQSARFLKNDSHHSAYENIYYTLPGLFIMIPD